MGATNCCTTQRQEDRQKLQKPIELASGFQDIHPSFIGGRIDLRHFEFKQTLKGTLGPDFIATNIETQQKFILKKIKMFVLEDIGLVMNKQINFQIVSPYLVKVVCAYQENDCFHVFAEYIEGQTLHRKIFINTKLSEELARFYLCEIIVVLQYLHRNKIIYRNLSPERILIDREGHIKLCNFGVSQIFKWPRNSRMGCMSEAVDYKSPEQIRGQEFDFYSDLWQLGILLWHMLTGVSPFISKDREVIKDNILAGPINIEKRLMSTQARDLILKLVQRKPDQRLGAIQNGFMEIREHKFFQSVNWAQFEMKAVKPPKLEKK